MRRLGPFVCLGLLGGTYGCQRSQDETAQDQARLSVTSAQQAAAAELGEKERQLAEREAVLRRDEEQRINDREAALAQREAALALKEQQAEHDQATRQATKDAAPRPTTVTVQLQIAMTRPDGKSWDIGGGAPDPEITLLASNGMTATQRFSDALTPSASFKVTLTSGDRVTIKAVDKDTLNASDPIGSFTVTYKGRATTQSGEMGAAKLTMSFSN